MAVAPQAEADRLRVSSPHRLVEWRNGQTRAREDWLAQECPVALVYNGISHVVMMATPVDLEDFALGFSLTEGILEAARELLDCQVVARDNGLEVQLQISARRFAELKARRRNLTGRTGCGLCGAESLSQAIRPVPTLAYRQAPSHDAIERSVAQLADWQPLQAETGACHGAAWCDAQGSLLAAREDVGRHNALDKLIGHWLGQGGHFAEGFALISSRGSVEMVQKCAQVGISSLVAVSAPTALAVNYAQQANMNLVGFARPGRHQLYHSSFQIEKPS
ncbi:MAG: formate dehydrogenase accessory sulfurtransferase FdhD [Saccharospirillum sp.]